MGIQLQLKKKKKKKADEIKGRKKKKRTQKKDREARVRTGSSMGRHYFLNAILFNRCGGVFVSSVSDRVAMVITYMFPEKK